MKFFMTGHMLPASKAVAFWGNKPYEEAKGSMHLRDYPNGTYFFVPATKTWWKNQAGRPKTVPDNSVPNQLKLLLLIHGGPA